MTGGCLSGMLAARKNVALWGVYVERKESGRRVVVWVRVYVVEMLTGNADCWCGTV